MICQLYIDTGSVFFFESAAEGYEIKEPPWKPG